MSSRRPSYPNLSAASCTLPKPVLLFRTFRNASNSSVESSRLQSSNRHLIMSVESVNQVCIHCRDSTKIPHLQCHCLNSTCCTKPNLRPNMCSLSGPSYNRVTVRAGVNVTKCRFCDSYTTNSAKFRGSLKGFTFSDSGWRKLLPLFILAISLLLLPTSTMSNPIPTLGGTSSSSDGNPSSHHRHHTKLHEREQKWINPCRIPSALPTFSADGTVQAQPDEDIIHNIIVQARKAEAQAQEFYSDFYKEAFGGQPDEDRYENLTYEFLNDIMGTVKAGHSDEELSKLELNNAIRLLYQGLQKFAVGLEAIVLDQACYGGSFYHHFNEAEFQLKYVLCELQIAMLEKNISHNDITREIMATEYRDLGDKTIRNIRDWTIFRDYVKTLRYVDHAMMHFKHRIRNSQAASS